MAQRRAEEERVGTPNLRPGGLEPVRVPSAARHRQARASAKGSKLTRRLAYDEKLAERVRDALASRRGVTEKVLMGTLAFMVEGAMCCSVGRDGLLVRANAETHEMLLVEPNVSPMKLGARTMTSFVCVAPAGLRTRAQLAKWLERGLRSGSTPRSRTSPGSRRAAAASSTQAAAAWAALARRFAARPGVSLPAAKRGKFGSSALKVQGKIFAMLVKGALAVKLSPAEVESSTAAGRGAPLSMGRSRVMKEWLVVSDPPPRWYAVAERARAFVAAQAKESRVKKPDRRQGRSRGSSAR